MSALPHPPQDEHYEDIFLLSSQINYINAQLGKENDSSVTKIKDIFKTREGINAIKKGINERLDELVEHGPAKLKDDVNRLKIHWNKVQRNLQDEKEISNFLKNSANELKQQMDRVYDKSFRVEFYPVLGGDQPDRITSAVQPYFEAISEKTLEDVEDRYHKTIKVLFDLALKLKEGAYGKRLSEAFGFFSDAVSSPESLLSLLIIDLSRSSTQEDFLQSPPEIIDKLKKDNQFNELFDNLRKMEVSQIEKLILNHSDNYTSPELLYQTELADLHDILKVPRTDLNALLQIFNKIAANLDNPTSQLIDLLTHLNQFEKATTYAKSIPQMAEQSKALLNIVLHLLTRDNLPEAMKLTLQIKNKSDKNKAISKVIEKFLAKKQLDQAVSFAKSLYNLAEVDNALEEIAIQLTKIGEVEKALDLTHLMMDSDIKDYTLSRLVNMLAAKGRFEEANDIALTIEDQGFREDAFGYMIKKLLNLRKVDEAIKLVEKIKNPKEKNLAAKIVESAMVAYHEDEKVKKVRNLFSIIKDPVRL